MTMDCDGTRGIKPDVEFGGRKFVSEILVTLPLPIQVKHIPINRALDSTAEAISSPKPRHGSDRYLALIMAWHDKLKPIRTSHERQLLLAMQYGEIALLHPGSLSHWNPPASLFDQAILTRATFIQFARTLGIKYTTEDSEQSLDIEPLDKASINPKQDLVNAKMAVAVVATDAYLAEEATPRAMDHTELRQQNQQAVEIELPAHVGADGMRPMIHLALGRKYIPVGDIPSMTASAILAWQQATTARARSLRQPPSAPLTTEAAKFEPRSGYRPSDVFEAFQRARSITQGKAKEKLHHEHQAKLFEAIRCRDFHPLDPNTYEPCGNGVNAECLVPVSDVASFAATLGIVCQSEEGSTHLAGDPKPPAEVAPTSSAPPIVASNTKSKRKKKRKNDWKSAMTAGARDFEAKNGRGPDEEELWHLLFDFKGPSYTTKKMKIGEETQIVFGGDSDIKLTRTSHRERFKRLFTDT